MTDRDYICRQTESPCDAGDVTRWLRDEATGLVTNKVYADGKGPRYDYTPDGKLATRTWARGIVTTYSYDDKGKTTRQRWIRRFVELEEKSRNFVLHLRMITVEWLELLNSMIPIIRSLVKVKTQAIQ